MKKTITTLLLFLAIFSFKLSAQEKTSGEQYGKTLNLGLGIGYYGYDRSLPVFHLNYELDVAKDFTLAPFISFYTYSNRYIYYWGNKNYPFRYYNYTYRETVIPIGVKGTYYFDDLLHANSKWDFYLAASLGFAIVSRSTTWDDDYYGDRDVYTGNKASSLYLDLHIGAEYHFNSRLGMFLDLSTGVSTIGLAIH